MAFIGSTPADASTASIVGPSNNTWVREEANTTTASGPAGARIFTTIRVRPQLLREGPRGCVSVASGERRVVVYDQERGWERSFGADAIVDSRAGGQGAGQIGVYEAMGRELVEHTLEGYNSCLLAYGHTGSGKTHTVLGEEWVSSSMNASGFSEAGRDGEGDGLLPRMLDAIFSRLGQTPGVTFTASFYEIYNERVRDLLLSSPPTPAAAAADPGMVFADVTVDGRDGASGEAGRQPKVHFHPRLGAFVTDVTEVPVACREDALQAVSLGASRRTTAATALNECSSRSHAVFTLKIERPQEGGAPGATSSNVLTVVDLAGREQERHTQCRAELFKELTHINRSLFHLAHCVRGVAGSSTEKGAEQWHHFRNCKLTMVLCQALAGNSRTAVLATISPAREAVEDTLATLRFCESVRQVRTRPALQPTGREDTVTELQNEVRRLKEELQRTELKLAQSQQQNREREVELERRDLAESLPQKRRPRPRPLSSPGKRDLDGVDDGTPTTKSTVSQNSTPRRCLGGGIDNLFLPIRVHSAARVCGGPSRESTACTSNSVEVCPASSSRAVSEVSMSRGQHPTCAVGPQDCHYSPTNAGAFSPRRPGVGPTCVRATSRGSIAAPVAVAVSAPSAGEVVHHPVATVVTASAACVQPSPLVVAAGPRTFSPVPAARVAMGVTTSVPRIVSSPFLGASASLASCAAGSAPSSGSVTASAVAAAMRHRSPPRSPRVLLACPSRAASCLTSAPGSLQPPAVSGVAVAVASAAATPSVPLPAGAMSPRLPMGRRVSPTPMSHRPPPQPLAGSSLAALASSAVAMSVPAAAAASPVLPSAALSASTPACGSVAHSPRCGWVSPRLHASTLRESGRSLDAFAASADRLSAPPSPSATAAAAGTPGASASGSLLGASAASASLAGPGSPSQMAAAGSATTLATSASATAPLAVPSLAAAAVVGMKQRSGGAPAASADDAVGAVGSSASSAPGAAGAASRPGPKGKMTATAVASKVPRRAAPAALLTQATSAATPEKTQAQVSPKTATSAGTASVMPPSYFFDF
eukprot:TRINITY_DN29034_c0_g1_i1.p1 TRINITY_DN29034_c0_g1~~TRINITY_DN29034_c0_g1_i1.p1  ORF type:complete len:1049 (-),score=196.17 TRINITY_DN29034_c0_g1_i1:1342-4488(-)